MRKLLLLIGLLFISASLMGVFFVPSAWLSVPAPETESVRVQIPVNATLDVAIDKLSEKKILRSGIGYRLYSYLDSSAEMPKAGEYDLKPGMNYRKIARILALGPERDEISMTVIEGWTISNIQEALKDEGIEVLPSDFYSDRFDEEFAFLKDLPPNTTLEGYLFPDTYRIWKDQLPDALFRKQLQEFSLKTMDFEAVAKSQGRTLADVIILASIIEKEAKHDEDRPIIAGIFMNRLKIGMRLQSDATLNYVLKNGHSRLTATEMEMDSPYNTYKYLGFPPGPISNPGLASLKAALNPAKTDFFYFLTDAEGKAYFARNLEEHVRNKAKAF